MVVFLLVMTLSLLVAMALWMASPLVLFRGYTPAQALMESFNANFRNVRALTVYGLGMVALAIVADAAAAAGISRSGAACDDIALRGVLRSVSASTRALRSKNKRRSAPPGSGSRMNASPTRNALTPRARISSTCARS